MDITVKTFLENGDKRVTIFKAPSDGERESVMFALRQKVKEYTSNVQGDFQEFIEEHNPFVRIVVEGIGKA